MERLACLVPFCRRTTRAGKFEEWICQRHWSATDRRLRRAYFRRGRLFKRHVAAADRSGGRLLAHASAADRHLQRGWALWERLKRQAIERAGGLA
ncbi:MAG TPA: hypothetical protein VHG92_02805 [Afifellaceae bacterium]|nr:hypothetical protein [Afifellaceae bacterium]